ncbi:MAG: M48 family metalloprotease [Candidatus Wallbacteria bacterium]|nr:M48 family metalloprotease [Candidatus Wallbacteria bacterium]
MKSFILLMIFGIISLLYADDLYTQVHERKLNLYLEQARKEHAAGDNNGAISYYLKAIQSQENFPAVEDAYSELFRVYLDRSQYRTAMDLKADYLKRFPGGKYFQGSQVPGEQSLQTLEAASAEVANAPVPGQAEKAPEVSGGLTVTSEMTAVPSIQLPQPVEEERKSGWVRFRDKIKKGFRGVQNVSESALGAIVSASVNLTTSFAKDDAINNRVETIGRKVAAQSPRQDVKYSFHVTKDKELNAFAVPGGGIYVTEGTVKATLGDDSALAGVLAHEIGHVTSRHSIHALEKSMLFQQILNLSNNKTIDKYKQALQISYIFMAQLPISRENEYEADQWGVTLSKAAGYDPKGLVRFFELLQKENKGGESKMGVMLSTHPATPDRIDHANQIIAGLK